MLKQIQLTDKSVIIIRVTKEMSMEQAEHLGATLTDMTGCRDIMIIEPGADITILEGIKEKLNG